jgi:hypothetical protein
MCHECSIKNILMIEWAYYKKESERWEQGSFPSNGVDYSDPVGTIQRFLNDQIDEFKGKGEPSDEQLPVNIIVAAFGIGRTSAYGAFRYKDENYQIVAAGGTLEGKIEDFVESGFDLIPDVNITGAITVGEDRLPFREIRPDKHIIGSGVLKYNYSLKSGDLKQDAWGYRNIKTFQLVPQPFSTPYIIVIGPRGHKLMSTIMKGGVDGGWRWWGHNNAEILAQRVIDAATENASELGELPREEKRKEMHKIIDRLLELEVMGLEFDPKENFLARSRGEYTYGDRTEIEASILIDRYKKLSGGRLPRFLEDDISNIANDIPDE